MKRTHGRGPQEPENRYNIFDYVADYAMDAAEAGIDPEQVADALREAADEIEFRDRMQEIDTEEVEA